MSVGEAEVDVAGRLAVQTELIDAIAVEVAHEGLVARIAEVIGDVCGTETALVLSQLVDDEEAVFVNVIGQLNPAELGKVMDITPRDKRRFKKLKSLLRREKFQSGQ